MDLHIGDKKFHFWEFPEKISHLKNKSKIDFDFSIYTDNHQKLPGFKDSYDDLSYLKNLKDIPSYIYVSKSNYYYWVFSECKLLDLIITQDKNFYDYQGRDIEKFDIKISISYGDVIGSNKKNLIDRDIKLKQLFTN